MIRKLALSAACLVISNLSLALSGYQIELIVFSHLNGDSFNSETWPVLTNPLPTSAKAINLNTTEANKDFTPTTQYKLNTILYRLSKHPNYKILLHKAWYESLEQLNSPTTIKLTGGKNYQSSVDELMGNVTVSLNRYFDVKFDLTLAFPQEQVQQLTDNEKYLQQPYTFISLQQTRRTKSQELNYIDHPLYGVLFEIIPVKDFQPSNAETTSTKESPIPTPSS